MLLWCAGASVLLFCLWCMHLLVIRPHLHAARVQREVRQLSQRSLEQLRRELVRRADRIGLTKLYPEGPLFLERPAKSAQELAERWDETFSLARCSDAAKSTHGPSGDVYLFYDGGLVTVREALELKLKSGKSPPNPQCG